METKRLLLRLLLQSRYLPPLTPASPCHRAPPAACRPPAAASAAPAADGQSAGRRGPRS